MASNITLSAGVRQNLLSLQNTAELMSQTQNRLATGKKVNSALDNPTNFFTSASLQSRASDISALLDNMSNGIKTLEAADNGLSAITKTVESMQSTLRQARQDKSFKTESYTISDTATGNISFSGGAVGTTPVDIALTTTVNTAAPATTSGTVGSLTSASTLAAAGVTGTGTITVSDGTTTHTFNVTDASTQTVGDLIGSINGNGALNVTASLNNDGEFTLTADNNTTGITIGGTVTTGVTGVATQGVPAAVNTVTVKSVDALVTEINSNASLTGKIRASNDNGKLRIENQSTAELSVSTGTGVTGAATIGGNQVRANFVKQFNELRDQLDKLADDASFNGINLLRGDKLKLTFNETGTSTIEIQAKDEDGQERPINSSTLGIQTVANADFDSDDTIDSLLDDLSTALGTLRSQSSSFGSNLSIVENRTDFTKAMINTLQTGADALVLADTNEEAANMLALQTRQQLSSTALSLASQADQAVLRLF